MLEYCEKSADNEEHSAQADDVGDATGVAGKMPTYMDLAADYGIELEMEISEPSEKVQTVEQEYQAYITSALSPRSVNILRFWEVRR